MAEPASVAHLPAAPLRMGLAVGATVFGLIALAAVVVTSAIPALSLGLAVFFAVSFGLFMWLFFRGRADTQRATVSRSEGPVRGRRRVAFSKGVLQAVLLAVTEAVVVGALVGFVGPDDFWPFLPGVLLGLGLSVALEVRDLRRWQDSTGLELFTRSDAPRIAFTSRQADASLVAVVQGQRPAEHSTLP